jgi:putative spermidine/putrescine transport system ATP-binding protein
MASRVFAAFKISDKYTAALEHDSEQVAKDTIEWPARVALELCQVTKSYSEVPAVRDISLSLSEGEFLTLLGPSGCGKTTLLNMVAGFFPPSSGQVLIQGRDVTRLMPHQRNTGIVFQNYALFPHMTVAQNVAFGLEERDLSKAEIRDRVGKMLTMVNLPGFDDRRPSQLSGGQQQRVALARALVIEPQVLLLDEPFSALDKSLRTKMQIELKQIQRKAKVATVFVTHDQSEALSLSDRIAVMNAGRVEQIGEPHEIYRFPRTRFVASFIGEINRIPVIVRAIGSSKMELDGPMGLRFSLPRSVVEIGVGDAVDLFVRPEDIEITDKDDDLVNTKSAEVVAASYQGSFTHVVLSASGLENIMVAAPLSQLAHTIKPGQKVKLRFNLERASLLAE